MAEQPERRELSFQSLEEVLAEAERLAAMETRVTGHHSFGKILYHLAISQDSASGRAVAPAPPFFMKLFRPLVRMMVINSKPMKGGFKLPSKAEGFFWPDQEVEVVEGLQLLKASTEHYLSKGPLENHPFFGRLTRAEADSLSCRHAALHLSFVHPV